MEIDHQVLIEKLVKLQSEIQKIRNTNDDAAKNRYSSLLDGMIFLLEEFRSPDRNTQNLIEAINNLKSQLFKDGGKVFYIDETKIAKM